MCFKNNSEGISSTEVDEKKKGHILKKKGGEQAEKSDENILRVVQSK